jgi:chromosome segregation ATPase
MSTAGKVLVVLVMLVSVVWMILAGGVAQLNRNGNEALQKLTADLQKVEEDLADAKREIVGLRDQTNSTLETIDREVFFLRARQSNLEAARSQISESLSRLRYQLATVEETIKTAQTSLENRNKEYQDEEKAIDELRTEVKSIKTANSQLMDRLQSLRQNFQKTHRANLETISKRQ